MSPERTLAYRRVMKTLVELGPSKLLDGEQDRIRNAADNLIFSSDLAEDVVARDALDDMERLCHALTESGRWAPVTAERLVDDLVACGPKRLVELRAA
jgi:hypothetical protein